MSTRWEQPRVARTDRASEHPHALIPALDFSQCSCLVLSVITTETRVHVPVLPPSLKHISCSRPVLGCSEQHTTMMSNSKSYVCPVCGRALSSPGSLGRHLLIHSEDRLSNCAVCGARFTDTNNFNRWASRLALPPPQFLSLTSHG